MNFETKHGAIPNSKSLKLGQSIDYVVKTLGQESLISNNGTSIYYISSDSKHAYFLRPKTIKYNILKIDFANQKISKISNFNNQVEYNKKFSKALKSQDKIKLEDFFKEVVGTSAFIPSN
jgi:outer membrane protein assembly factor BamE (lipoprotein component of BamABCDE complex)